MGPTAFFPTWRQARRRPPPLATPRSPGDHVRLMEGEVYVNGKRQSEPFVIRNGSFSNYRDNFPAVQPTERDGVIPEWRRGLASHIRNDELVVPKDSYFAMGDNRDDSSD